MLNRHHIKYLTVYISPALVACSLWFGGIWSYLTLVYVFGFIPFLELFFKGNSHNLSAWEEEMMRDDPFYDYLLYGLVPVQYLLLALFLYRMQDENLAYWEKAGMVTAMGIACGALGINIAHELGHRKTKLEQWLSRMLLVTTQYMHFFIEHNRGHHLHVSTDEDPASAKEGETVYAFFIRSVRDSWLSAWQLERQRLKKARLPFWSLHNEMLRYQLIQVSFIICIGIFMGAKVLPYYLAAAILGFLLLETVNYIEHYGLRRKKLANGRYEQTLPVHSWNSNHPLGRILLLELTRHSDHHYQSTRKYQILRHFDDSPQMPTGYPGMMLLALMPPAWFAVMHRRLMKFRQTPTGTALA